MSREQTIRRSILACLSQYDFPVAIISIWDFVHGFMRDSNPAPTRLEVQEQLDNLLGKGVLYVKGNRYGIE
jgi:hypothetical protein